MRRAARRRFLFYGGFVATTLGFYLYQPVRIDLFPRSVPVPNPTVDPDAKRLFSRDARVAVLTAHPDDAEYYAGALLAKLHKNGARVTLVVLTDGDKGFEPWEDAAANRRVRRTEQTAAARAWGAAAVTFLGFRDGRLGESDETVGRATDALRGAEWVVSFDGDYPPKVAHRDHRVAGDIAERAARNAGARWLVRFATHAPNGTFDLTGFDLAQHALLDLHRSQFSGEKEARVWGTVFETGTEDGERSGTEYGLAFRASRLPATGSFLRKEEREAKKGGSIRTQPGSQQTGRSTWLVHDLFTKDPFRMKIFLTGATGFIGSYLVPELIDAGHRVVGLCRSEAGAEALTHAGAEAFRGDVNDLPRLRAAAEAADGVIHAAFNHDFSNLKQSSEDDRKAIETMGEALAGSDRPLVVTSGTGLARPKTGGPAVETDDSVASDEFPRAATEEAAEALVAKGGRVMVMRLPQVHDARHQGRITFHIQTARQQGRVAYVGEGKNRVPAVHVSDAVRLYRLALERGLAGMRYHAVGEEGIALRDIAEAIGAGLKMPVESIAPEEAPGYFGPMAQLATLDLAASSALTCGWLDWKPTGPDLLTDLRSMDYRAT